MFPDLPPQWFLVVTSDVTQTVPGVSPEAAADAAAAEILQSLSASGTQFANLESSDTHLASWSGPLPAQGSGGGGGNVSSFQVTVAQSLLGQPSADQTGAITRDVALGQASALANGSHSDVLGANWPVLASAATVAASGDLVGTGQRIGTADTKEVLYTSCLPASLGNNLPLNAHTHAAFVNASAGSSPDTAACAAGGGYPSSGYWLVGTLIATALPLNATNNGGASQAVAAAWGTPYAESMERSDFMDTLTLTLLSALADEGAAHTSLQLLSWEASARAGACNTVALHAPTRLSLSLPCCDGPALPPLLYQCPQNGTVEYAFTRPLTQQLAPSVVASIPLPYSESTFARLWTGISLRQ